MEVRAEITWSVECLVYKHDELRSVPRLDLKPDVVACAPPSTGEAEMTGGSLRLAGQPA